MRKKREKGRRQKKTDRQTKTMKDGQTGIQIDRQTERQIKTSKLDRETDMFIQKRKGES